MNDRERHLECLQYGRTGTDTVRSGESERIHLKSLARTRPGPGNGVVLLALPRDRARRLPDIPSHTPTSRLPHDPALRREGSRIARDGHYVVLDWMGNTTEISDHFDLTYIRQAKDFVTRKWHRHPVQSRNDFDCLKVRYDPANPTGFPPTSPSVVPPCATVTTLSR